MGATILDGKEAAASVRSRIRDAVSDCVNAGGRRPCLAVILVGHDAASAVYVANKRRACEEAGIRSLAFDLPATATEAELLALIDTLNADPAVDGILVQLPLPREIRTSHVIEHIHPAKDVDGFHPCNLGRLAQRHPSLRPCTPLGIMHLLKVWSIPVRGMHAVVVGASNIVGRPMALEFLLAGATVTICHRFTRNLGQHVASADIVVVAVGKQDVVDVAWLGAHQTVIDVGIHRLPDGTLRGDVDFGKAKDRVAAVTPVPGGVGPMTIAMLLRNTLHAAGIRLPDH